MSTLTLKARRGAGCDIAGCRGPFDLRLHAGASTLNMKRDVQLCDEHWKAWLDKESEQRANLSLLRQDSHNETRST